MIADLKQILPNGQLTFSELKVHGKMPWGFEIKWSNEGRSPELTLDRLIQLTELFGTTKINVDNYAVAGCDTCDYGSDYGHTIQVYAPSKNVDEIWEQLRKAENG